MRSKNNLFQKLDLQNPNHMYTMSVDLNSKHADQGNLITNSEGNILTDWLYDNEINVGQFWIYEQPIYV